MDIEQFYEKLEELHGQRGPDSLERFLRQSLAGAERADDPALALAAQSELGTFYRSTGRFQESLDAFRQAEQSAEALYGTDSCAYATVLNNAAGTCRLMHRCTEAEELFLRAMEVYRRAGLEHSRVYTSVLSNLSLMYQQNGDLQKAIAYLEQALTHMEDQADRQQELAVTYNNLTALYHAAGEREKAMQCVNRALQAYERCPEAERVCYTAVLNSLAGYLYGEGDCHRALALYRQSSRYALQFFGETEEYGVICQNMRWVYEKLGDREAAMRCLRRAGTVYTKLFGADSDRTRAVEEELRRMSAESGGKGA